MKKRKIILTESEIEYLMTLDNSIPQVESIQKKLKNISKKRPAKISYKKSIQKRQIRENRLTALIRSNPYLSNADLIQKSGISKGEFYRNYKSFAEDLKKEYSSMSLFDEKGEIKC